MDHKIYQLTKNINSIIDDTGKEEELLELQSILNDEITQLFESEKSSEIEDVINHMLKNEEVSLLEILLDEVSFEIENALYEDDNGKTMSSTMVLIPCIMVSKSKNLTIPSINSFEEKIRDKFIEKQLINEKNQFNLGTLRLSQTAIDSLSIYDWWKTHRELIGEFEIQGKEKIENDKIRNLATRFDIEEPIQVVYFIGQILSEEDNQDICENIFHTDLDTDFWHSIAQDFSTESLKFIILPSLPVHESLENTQAILENVTFELFFDENFNKDIEILYAPIKETDDYVIMFFDGESLILENFYIYNTEGDKEHFIFNLLEKCIKKSNANLYSHPEAIDIDTITDWQDGNQIIDVTDLLKEANQIDLCQSYKICNFIHKDTDIIKQTIH